MSRFDEACHGWPPWDIGRSQAAAERLAGEECARAGRFESRIRPGRARAWLARIVREPGPR